MYFKENGLESNRLGFSVSKKVGKSVVRNRIKRIYREAFKILNSNLKNGFDLIVVARKPAAKSTFIEAEEELRKICSRAGLLKRG